MERRVAEILTQRQTLAAVSVAIAVQALALYAGMDFSSACVYTAELLSWRRRPSSVVRPSVVRKLKFLGNRCMDPGQILWVAPCPPYLQTIYFSPFSKF